MLFESAKPAQMELSEGKDDPLSSQVGICGRSFSGNSSLKNAFELNYSGKTVQRTANGGLYQTFDNRDIETSLIFVAQVIRGSIMTLYYPVKPDKALVSCATSQETSYDKSHRWNKNIPPTQHSLISRVLL